MKKHLISLTLSDVATACAIFEGQKLISWDAANLQEDPEKRANIITAQIMREIQDFDIGVAVLEKRTDKHSSLNELLDVAKELFRRKGIPIFEITEHEVRQSFSLPAPPDREQLRQITARIFPEIPFSGNFSLCLDASAFALHFETERLLSIYPKL